MLNNIPIITTSNDIIEKRQERIWTNDNNNNNSTQNRVHLSNQFHGMNPSRPRRRVPCCERLDSRGLKFPNKVLGQISGKKIPQDIIIRKCRSSRRIITWAGFRRGSCWWRSEFSTCCPRACCCRTVDASNDEVLFSSH